MNIQTAKQCKSTSDYCTDRANTDSDLSHRSPSHPKASKEHGNSQKGQSKPHSVKKAPLFREEAIESQNARLDGNVLITQSLAFRNFALFFTLVCILIISFMTFGSYTRKVTVPGYLEPKTGLSKVYPTRSGRISSLWVADGDVVKKGDHLAKVIIDSVSDSGGYAYQAMADELTHAIEALAIRRQTIIEDYNLEKSRLKFEINTSVEQLNALLKNQQLLIEKNKIIDNKLSSLNTLQKTGSISHTQYKNQELEALDSELALNEVTKSINESRHILHESKIKLKGLPLKHKTEISDIDQKISELRRQLTDTNIRHAYTIIAPVDGVVSALSYRLGDNLSAEFPLLTILPESYELQARIYLPSSSISFVHIDQDIKIQYQALPVQRFGTYSGRITHISSSPINPQDVKNAPYNFNEPVYLVTAEISDQKIMVKDSVFPIVPGMTISISLLAESQTIFQWLTDPFWNIKGRIQ
jgi:membrane fusion protein